MPSGCLRPAPVHGSRLLSQDRVAGKGLTREQRQHLHLLRRRKHIIGWVVVALGGVIGVIHWLGHLGAFGSPPSTLADLVAGYPAAGVLIVIGFVLVGQ